MALVYLTSRQLFHTLVFAEMIQLELSAKDEKCQQHHPGYDSMSSNRMQSGRHRYTIQSSYHPIILRDLPPIPCDETDTCPTRQICPATENSYTHSSSGEATSERGQSINMFFLINERWPCHQTNTHASSPAARFFFFSFLCITTLQNESIKHQPPSTKTNAVYQHPTTSISRTLQPFNPASRLRANKSNLQPLRNLLRRTMLALRVRERLRQQMLPRSKPQYSHKNVCPNEFEAWTHRPRSAHLCLVWKRDAAWTTIDLRYLWDEALKLVCAAPTLPLGLACGEIGSVIVWVVMGT